MLSIAKYLCVMGLGVLSLFETSICAQKTDVLTQETNVLTQEQVRVRKTTKWAAVLPGSGQVINKKVWKVPFVLGGLATAGWFVVDNTKQMNLFREHWGYETDEDPTTNSTLTDNDGDPYILSDLENGTYFYRRNRDLSYLAFLGVYLLQIVDANVDSHMKFFDASEDLSWKVLPPQLSPNNNLTPWQMGLCIRINNK